MTVKLQLHLSKLTPKAKINKIEVTTAHSNQSALPKKSCFSSYTFSPTLFYLHFIKGMSDHNATTMAIRVVANDHNKLTGLQFIMPRLESRSAAWGRVASAAGI